ncbi:MAG: hypothetical protein JXL97_07100 [Bacteroidales bacterium]|nr:hypothetical protein [Bacteroidales bacterium]
MKTIYYILIFYFFTTISAFSQTPQIGEYFELDENLTGETYIYRARDYIELQPGFEYSAEGNKFFYAEIAPSIILPIDYNEPQIPWSDEFDVGSLPGQASVSPMGGATYQIPIQVSPGTAGVQPNLSIVYNSQSQGGVLGQGWDISGFSMITRVPANTYYDGQIDPVDFDESDRFVLDGQRLIAINGEYGVANTTYATEIESFSEITTTWVSSNGYGPQTFKVATKDGAELHYGYEEYSRIQTELENNATINFWLLDRIIDPNGNYMTISYKEIDGYFYPEEIRYTGTEEFEPYNVIKFYYSEKIDNSFSYISGGSVVNKLLLRKIDVSSNEKLKWSYEFKYTKDIVSKLSEVFLYNENGEHLNTTKIDWLETNNMFEITKSEAISTSSVIKSNSLFVDIDGLSKQVPVKVTYDNEAKTQISFSSTHPTISFNSKYEFVNKGDFDGDGKEEILIVLKSEEKNDKGVSYFYVCDNLETGNYSIHKVLEKKIDADLEVGDFNGDGKTDFLFEDNNNNVLNYKIVNNSAVLYKSKKIPKLREIRVADFNGDGVTDILTISAAENYLNIYDVSKGSFNLYHSSNILDNKSVFRISDFNGDGKTDIFVQDNNDNTKWLLYFNMANGIFRTPVTITNSYQDAVLVGNFAGLPSSNVVFCQVSDQILYIRMYTFYGYNKWNIKSGSVSIAVNNILEFNQNTIESYIDQNYDGKQDIYTGASTTSGYPAYYLIAYKPEVNTNSIQTITDGYDNKVEYTMESLTAKNSFGSYTNTDDNVLAIVPPIYVTTELTNNFKEDGNYSAEYSYGYMLVHKHGKGFMGFNNVATRNINANTETITNYDYFRDNFFLFPVVSKTSVSNGIVISKSKYNYNKITFPTVSNLLFIPIIDSTITVDELHGISEITDYTYDNYGNLTYSSTKNGLTEAVVVNTYTDNGTGIDYLPETSKIIKKRPNEVPYIRNIEYQYYNNGTLKQEISDLGTDFEITTVYEYDNFGNPEKILVTPKNMQTRISRVQYDNKGRLPIKKINPLGQFATYTYNYSTGSVLSETSINGLQTFYEYDNWGQLTKSILPDGNFITNNITWSDKGQLYASITTNIDGTTSRTDYDRLQRDVFFENTGYNGEKIISAKSYNNKGQLIRTVEPHYYDTEYHTIEYSYDNIGRILRIYSTATGSETTYNYGSLGSKETTITTNNKETTQIINDAGEVTETTDNGGTINYTYYASGLTKDISYDNNTVHLEYDLIGNKIQLNDPDAGIIRYTYDALGNLTQQIDNEEHVFNMQYDILNRLIVKEAPEGTTTYTYDSQPNGKGKIASVTGFNGISETYFYDQLSRNFKTTETVDEVDYSYTYTYDNLSRVKTVTYPGGFSITKNYDNFGYLKQIRRTDNNQFIWQLDNINEYGQITRTTLANQLMTTYSYNDENHTLENISTPGVQNYNYFFDPTTGNLIQRKLNNFTENFEYDNLDRLVSVRNQNNDITLSMRYIDETNPNGNGNIEYQTNVGTYNYDHPTKPHAVTGLEPSAFLPEQNLQNITYTSFNKVNSISEIDYELIFTYNSSYERKKTELYQNEELIKTKYFFGAYEKEISHAGTRELNYITSPDGVIAIYEQTSSGDEIYYIHKDHLGSITEITDQDGKLLQRFYYSPWGVRETLVDKIGRTITDRGYTGHEHLPEFSLINMNGRVYDPILARFLSPDNYVQLPDFTQSFNRFSYAFNNPLKYTDPDGEFIFSAFLGPAGVIIDGACWGALTGGISYGIGAIISGNGNWGDFGRAVAFGALSGALTGGFGVFSSSLGSFGNSVIYNTLSQTSSTVITNTIFGNKLNAGNIAGSVVSGLIGASMSPFNGIDGNGFKNALAEIQYSTLKGAMLGATSGSVSSLFTNNYDAVSQGFIGGAISGFMGGAFRIATMGPVVPYSRLDEDYVRKIETVRNIAIEEHGINNPGYPIVRNPWIHRQDASITSNILVNENNSKLASNGELMIYDDSRKYRHESTHYYQQSGLGTYQFYSRIFYEWLKFSRTTYDTHGTLEYNAQYESMFLY